MIETQRTTLRPISPEDNQQVFCYRSDSETNKYQGWIPKSINEVDEFIARNPTQFNKPDSWFQLVIIEKDTEIIIGDIGIHFLGTDNFQCEIGCTLSKDYQGKGFASETLKSVIDYLFDGLDKHRIVTSIDPMNISSINLVEKLGFRKEAHFKESLLINGQWVDDIVYAILKKEWR